MNYKPMRILIVEDDRVSRLIIERSLLKSGYETVAVDNIDAALRCVLEGGIQFVVTDWLMPGGNGTELCQKIRALNLPSYIYIILVTALEDAQSVVQGMDAGADDFIRKPVLFDELNARIRAGERILRLEQALLENNLRLRETSNQLLAAHETINRDLKMAAAMQRNLLPDAATQSQGIAIDWLFHPSTHLSGDIFNFFPLDERHCGFYIIDVAGHGIASAMQSFTLSRLLSPDTHGGSYLKCRSPTTPYQQTVQAPPAVVGALNRQFQTDISNILYFTMIYGVIDTQAKTLELCQAGHPAALYQHHQRPAEFIGKGGLPVGIIAETCYEAVRIHYQPGDRLFLYSDGVTECESPTGEMFGSERLHQVVEKTRGLPVAEAIRALDIAIRSWHGGIGFEDDISLLMLAM
ncbi:MAG: SpoIIE family protein phosphatase [Methylovulum sp.]|nr:SpoIIE family protein phosphatase [Methylovulum sp.]